MKNLIELAEKYDFVVEKNTLKSLVLVRGQERLWTTRKHFLYDSGVAYGPEHLGNRSAEWPLETALSDGFEQLFANTVGL